MKQLSISESKRIRSLQKGKYRDLYGAFLAERWNVVTELCKRFRPELIVLEDNDSLADKLQQIKKVEPSLIRLAEVAQLKKCSGLTSARDCIAVFKLPPKQTCTLQALTHSTSVLLDRVQDPGNVGTIIRLCEWLGISDIVLGKGCADAYSPKVVQASMGALAGIQLYQDVDLLRLLRQNDGTHQVTAATLGGEDLYRQTKPDKAQLIIFGNEGQGISPLLDSYIHNKITIKKAANSTASESLNVAVSAAIILSQLTQLKRN